MVNLTAACCPARGRAIGRACRRLGRSGICARAWRAAGGAAPGADGRAIVLGIGGGAVRLPRLPYVGAQAVIGCLIANTITPQIVRDVAANAPILFPWCVR